MTLLFFVYIPKGVSFIRKGWKRYGRGAKANSQLRCVILNDDLGLAHGE